MMTSCIIIITYSRYIEQYIRTISFQVFCKITFNSLFRYPSFTIILSYIFFFTPLNPQFYLEYSQASIEEEEKYKYVRDNLW